MAHTQTEFPPRPKHLDYNAKWDCNDQAKFIATQRQSQSLQQLQDQSIGIEM